MKITAPASAGTMESGDILIEIEPGEQKVEVTLGMSFGPPRRRPVK